jgi:hypothetical protein
MVSSSSLDMAARLFFGALPADNPRRFAAFGFSANNFPLCFLRFRSRFPIYLKKSRAILQCHLGCLQRS